MTRKELQTVLDEHKKWLDGEGRKRADLQDVNLRHANLRFANLQAANLQNADLHAANLRHANLQGVDLDHSCWPLWCGSLDAHIDTRIAVQLLYHLMRPCLVSDGVDDEFKKALFTPELIAWANKFHRVEECGEIEWPKEDAK